MCYILKVYTSCDFISAPEIIENKTYGYLCDVWAMGVITYMLWVLFITVENVINVLPNSLLQITGFYILLVLVL